MSAIRLTSKRQATFPKSLCDEMGVHSGDLIQIETTLVKGERVWYLKPASPVRITWFGKLKPFARGKAHGMNSVRASIARGRKRGGK